MLPFAHYWLIVNNDAFFPEDALEALHVAARRDALVLSAASPPWACFIVGDEVVQKVGGWDEGLHPGYFEDNDFERRCTFHGVPIIQSGVRVSHDNSSTINSDLVLRRKNDITFSANANYYAQKVQRGDMTEGRWDLATRRSLSWD
jgi:GT2 family glycosyltransferase